MSRFVLIAGMLFLLLQGCATRPVDTGQTTLPAPPPEPPQAEVVEDVIQPGIPLEWGSLGKVEKLPESIDEQVADEGYVAMAEPAMRKAQNPAVARLLDKSAQLQEQGDLSGASAAIERGLKISRQDADLYLRLAQLRQLQQRPDQAEQFAQRALQFARGNRAIVSASWEVILDSRLKMGDQAGAEEALSRTLMLKTRHQ